MIDTIRVKYHIIPKASQLEAWTIRSVETSTGKRYSLTYNPKSETQVLPRYTFYPLGYDETPILILEVSLPKMVLGNNYQEITNVESAIIQANTILENIPYTPELNLADGVLIRLDLCHNHQVGDAVDDFITAIGNLEFPHRRTKQHRGEGVEFRAKHKTTKFYNKEREVWICRSSWHLAAGNNDARPERYSKIVTVQRSHFIRPFKSGHCGHSER